MYFFPKLKTCHQSCGGPVSLISFSLSSLTFLFFIIIFYFLSTTDIYSILSQNTSNSSHHTSTSHQHSTYTNTMNTEPPRHPHKYHLSCSTTALNNDLTYLQKSFLNKSKKKLLEDLFMTWRAHHLVRTKKPRWLTWTSETATSNPTNLHFALPTGSFTVGSSVFSGTRFVVRRYGPNHLFCM